MINIKNIDVKNKELVVNSLDDYERLLYFTFVVEIGKINNKTYVLKILNDLWIVRIFNLRTKIYEKEGD